MANPGGGPLCVRQRVDVERNDPYADQVAHFAHVVHGREAPLVPGVDGLRSLAVVAGVIDSARTGDVVDIDRLLERP